ncbi:hypothetical protein B0O99DRAFT_643125 [Bisporella sp. PMI_857]|nr:hypothetical protein B0O99DRAFT_643125 [Bisporella sp. PMI_857]
MDPYSLLLRDPATICHMRARFFNITLPFRVTKAEYNLYWPIINNVYIFNKTRCASNASKYVEFTSVNGNFFIYIHSLDKSNAYKRNSAILAHLQTDITKSYVLAAVISFIRSYGQSKVINRLIAATNLNALFALLNAKNHVKHLVAHALLLNKFSELIAEFLLVVKR